MNGEATLESTNSFSIRKTLYFIIKRLFEGNSKYREA